MIVSKSNRNLDALILSERQRHSSAYSDFMSNGMISNGKIIFARGCNVKTLFLKDVVRKVASLMSQRS